VATTTTPPSSSPDWQELAETGLGFLKALAATVTPSPEQQAVADFYRALTGAFGRPSKTLSVRVNANNSVTVVDPPEEAAHYRIGNFGSGGTREEGSFSNPITLKTVDPTRTPLIVELYDADMVLLARGVIR
jgi:hypothetical protein